MDYLRDVIECLFQESDIRPVLRGWKDKNFSFLEQLSVPDLVHHLFAKNMREASLDQLYVVANTTNTCWMIDASRSEHMHFSSHKSIFNILLHFSGSILRIDGSRDVCCKWEHVLRWHELTSLMGEDWLVTAFMASVDLHDKYQRSAFNWVPMLSVDLPELEHMLAEMPLTDVHNHLQGSSLNFDLNWLSLMNNVTELDWDSILKNTHLKDKADEIKWMACQAACIRLFLFGYYDKYDKSTDTLIDKNLINALTKNNYVDAISSARIYLRKLYDCKQRAYKYYKYKPKGYKDLSVRDEYVDYAITRTTVSSYDYESEKYIYSVLSGERRLMYLAFRDIYNDKASNESIATLFYVYLLFKNKLHRILVQANDGIGFGNFNEYEQCKKMFILPDSVYANLLDQLAVSTLVASAPSLRYLETRIAPNTQQNVQAQIREKVEHISNPLFVNEEFNKKWQYDFVYHFIKTAPSDVEIKNPLQCRNYACREEVRECSLRIAEYAGSCIKGTKKVRGIDAANSEMNCRPEVFAQAYRYLRRISVDEYDEKLSKKCTYPLGITYHVGEDFYDIVDGLRAMDEAFRFLEYRSGDRIGHGLALGVSVRNYYEKRHYTLMMPKQVLLDNVVWLFHKMDKYKCGTTSLKLFLNQQYDELFRAIYPNKSIPLLSTYYDAWLLRGDDPVLYRGGMLNRSLSKRLSASLWERFAQTKGVRYVVARMNVEARQLNNMYHYNSKVKESGNASEVLKIKDSIREDWIHAIEIIQREILDFVEKEQFCIESNPTSNRKIGEFDRYDEHPALVYCSNDGINKSNHIINTSLNTDDRGVFATSLEREYALMAVALKKQGHSWNNIFQWLNKMRENGLKQAFVKRKNWLRVQILYIPKEQSERFEEQKNWMHLKWIQLIRLLRRMFFIKI